MIGSGVLFGLYSLISLVSCANTRYASTGTWRKITTRRRFRASCRFHGVDQGVLEKVAASRAISSLAWIGPSTTT